MALPKFLSLNFRLLLECIKLYMYICSWGKLLLHYCFTEDFDETTFNFPFILLLKLSAKAAFPPPERKLG